MSRKILYILAISLLFSCQQADDQESIKKKIASYKADIEDLNEKVADLENQLKNMDGADNTFRVPVEVLELNQVEFNHYIEVGGVVEAINEASISPETSGQINKIFVNEGDRVRKGQLLVDINSDITKSQIEEVESSLEFARTVYEKQKRLWDQRIGSEIQYLDAKNRVESLEKRLEVLRAQLDMAKITSPVNGIVDNIYMKDGELALPGVPLMLVVNLDQVYINADVSESYLSDVHTGEQVSVTFPAYPELKLDIPIHRKGNVINPNNRTFTVQLKLSNPENMLKPNILSKIYINDYSADSALVVPAELVKQDLKGSYVYVIDNDAGNLVARKAYISTGLSYGNKTMVTTGLLPGEKVIMTGYNQVSDGTIVEIKPNGVS